MTPGKAVWVTKGLHGMRLFPPGRKEENIYLIEIASMNNSRTIELF
jgi:hypothetical protein